MITQRELVPLINQINKAIKKQDDAIQKLIKRMDAIEAKPKIGRPRKVA